MAATAKILKQLFELVQQFGYEVADVRAREERLLLLTEKAEELEAAEKAAKREWEAAEKAAVRERVEKAAVEEAAERAEKEERKKQQLEEEKQ